MDIKPPSQPEATTSASTPTPEPAPVLAPATAKSTSVRDWVIAILLAVTIIGLPLAIVFIVWRQPKLSKGIKWGVTAIIAVSTVGLIAAIATSKPSTTPKVAETELKATVKTASTVGVLTSYKVENNNAQAWKNCTFTAGTDYVLKKDTFEVSAVAETLSVNDFKDSQGKAFNPLKDTDHTLTIACTIGDKELTGSYGK